MRGLSEIIVIVLLVMITVSVAGMAYVFEAASYDAAASGAPSYIAASNTPVKSFDVENINLNKLYIRNTGGEQLSNLMVYVNGQLAKYNISPSVIGEDQIGTITIYDFLKEDDMIIITSPIGYTSTKRVTDPCEKAVGCWKLDENDGDIAYDSSPNGHTGNLINGPLWTIGQSGSAIQFDGSNDYVKTSGFVSLGTSNKPYTIEGLIKASPGETNGNIIHMSSDSAGTGWCLPPVALVNGKIRAYSWMNGAIEALSKTTIESGKWYHFANTWDPQNGLRIFVNGILENTTQMPSYTASGASNYIWMAFSPSGCSGNNGWFNGAIDEVRIYNTAIY